VRFKLQDGVKSTKGKTNSPPVLCTLHLASLSDRRRFVFSSFRVFVIPKAKTGCPIGRAKGNFITKARRYEMPKGRKRQIEEIEGRGAQRSSTSNLKGSCTQIKKRLPSP